MPYPTPPTLNPFNASDVPNLMESGPYGTVLTQIMNYLAQLGQYVDAQIETVRAEIPSSTDFATADQLEEVSKTASAAASDAASAKETASSAQSTASTASGEAQEASATAATLTTNLANLVGTLNNISVGSDKLIIGINADGTGNPTSPASESIMEKASSASTVAGEALTDAENANSVLTNMMNDTLLLPTRINDDGSGVETASFSGLISPSGTVGNIPVYIARLITSLMLAAPNNEQSQLFGYLGDNSENLAVSIPKVRSSAALTAAYESGSGAPTKSPSDADLTSQDLAGMKKTTDGFAYVG